MAAEDKKIYVTMLGAFTMRWNDKEITETQLQSGKVLQLIAYMLCNHGKLVTMPEAAEILWEDEDNVNIKGALKNLVYRLRIVLKENFGEMNLICMSRGSYYINPEFEIVLDFEQMESAFKRAKHAESIKESVKEYKRAIFYYKGEFLQKFSDKGWVIPLEVYYHSMYLNLVKDIVKLLKIENRYEEIEKICIEALRWEQMDEDLYFLTVEALARQGKKDLARKYYDASKEMFYENLGIAPSDEMNRMYNELNRELKHQENDVQKIFRDLKEAAAPKKVFFCEYHIFREIFRLECRREQRGGPGMQITVLTVSIRPGATSQDSYKAEKEIKKGMEILKDVLGEGLRVGDVVTRFSAVQYLVLLSGCPNDAAENVVKRLINKYEKRLRNSDTEVTYEIEDGHNMIYETEF